VKANSLIESSTIAAILVGAIAGGMLADWSVYGTLAAVTATYAAAAGHRRWVWGGDVGCYWGVVGAAAVDAGGGEQGIRLVIAWYGR
jgi:hypothetical protein